MYSMILVLSMAPAAESPDCLLFRRSPVVVDQERAQLRNVLSGVKSFPKPLNAI